MKDFSLGILTPAGEAFSGRVQQILVRTTAGEVAILAGHTDYLAGVEPCAAKLTDGEGKETVAFCGGGFLSVVSGEVSLVVDEFVLSDRLSAEQARAERDGLAAELAACDKSTQPERVSYLKTALRRADSKLKAAES